MGNVNTIKIAERTWTYSGVKSDFERWTAPFICSDADRVVLYIKNNGTGFNLSCFSGIPGSEIYIDEEDFRVFEYAPNKIDGLTPILPYYEKCIMIADYICQKFCTYKEDVKKASNSQETIEPLICAEQNSNSLKPPSIQNEEITEQASLCQNCKQLPAVTYFGYIGGKPYRVCESCYLGLNHPY